MPEMNGFEALERLKVNKSWADIPVIFLTGTTNASIEERCSKLGAVGIVTKPFTADSLLDRIKPHLRYAQTA